MDANKIRKCFLPGIAALFLSGAAFAAPMQTLLQEDFEGVSGKFSLNANRDAVKALVFIKIENGQFRYTATVNP